MAIGIIGITNTFRHDTYQENGAELWLDWLATSNSC